MRCRKHDSHMVNSRTEWGEALCDDASCTLCATRPAAPDQCPEGPCRSCKYVETYLVGVSGSPVASLKGVVALINKHKVAKKLIQARLLKSRNDSTNHRMVVTCRFSNEVVVEIEGGRPSNEPRPAGARGIRPSTRAACWWVEYLEDLPDAEEVATPSHRAKQEARELELAGHWQERRWRL